MLKRIFNKKLVLFVAFIVAIMTVFVYSNDIVKAAGVNIAYGNETTYICFDKSTGAYKETVTGSGNYTKCKSKGYGYTILKLINDVYAYCANWKLYFYGGSSNYVKDTTWKYNSKNAIMAGYLINLTQEVNSKGYNVNKAYERAGAALNTLFAGNGDSGSYNFSSDSEIKGYLNQANTYYSSVKLTKNLPAVTISVKGGNILSYNDTTKKYFSGVVTLSGLVANYGGSSSTVTYTITAKANNGNSVLLCTDSKGTKCKPGQLSISNVSKNYTFYVFADKGAVNAGDDIVISVKGSNKSTYYSSVVYEDIAHSDAQKLITIDYFDVSRSVSKNTTLIVPDLSTHRIFVYKVDEAGNRLEGANLAIYQDNPTGTPLKTNNGNSSMVYYAGAVSSENDDFFNHSYYLVETSAPDGYIFTNSSTPFYTKASFSGTGTSVLCYKDDSDVAVDNEFCNFDNYYYMCKASDGTFKKPDDNGNCEQEITITPDNNAGGNVETDSTTGDVTTYEVVTDENTSSDVLNNTTTTEANSANAIVNGTSYTKVCYKADTNSVVGDEYCSDKESYTKVQHTKGNMVVFQTNSRNVIKVSKTDITGEKEIPGATLKICSKSDYESNKDECTAAKTIDDVEMSWISGDTAYSIYGVPKGSYYIVETIPPKGYVRVTTATLFSIDEHGKVVYDDKEITYEGFKNGSSIVVKNKITNLSISKRDIATKNELPGATISICRTYKDENGNIKMLVDQYTGDCIEATLADGTVATWVSTDKPKVISGLRADRTYYLVERIAPTDYSTAESILFTLNSDGTLSDINGNNLADNKLVMYDEPLENKKTGSLMTYIVIGILVGVALLGLGCFIYLRVTDKKQPTK